jgi:hypothetical protein
MAAKLTVNGITFSDTTQLNSKRGIFPQSTAWIFYQASAPTGWTKSTTNNDKGLRVVSGNGGGFAGSRAFSSTMTSFNYAGNISTANATGATALVESQIPSHSHPMNPTNYQLDAVPAIYNPDGSFNSWNGGDVQRAGGWTRTLPATGPGGSNSGHTHPVSATAPISVPISLAVQYIDVIVCTFDG